MEVEKQQQKMIRRAEQLVEATMAGRDASHDAWHAYRVRDLALSLAREEGLQDTNNLQIVELAALLHDIGICQEWRGLALGQRLTMLQGHMNMVKCGTKNSNWGVLEWARDFVDDTGIVEKFLEEEEVEEGKREKILSIIKGMGFKHEVSGVAYVDSSVEFGVVQDADRLDAIGAIGIARCFTYGGSKNHVLHDPAIVLRQELSKEKYMNKDEKQTTINHFHEKLFKLKDLMKTKAGKRRAEKRHKFMKDYVNEFYEEWSGRA